MSDHDLDRIDPLEAGLMNTMSGVLLTRCLRERREALDRVAELKARLGTLDEERLARALFARYALGHIAFPCGEDTEVEVAAIAKAYREDTDDRP